LIFSDKFLKLLSLKYGFAVLNSGISFGLFSFLPLKLLILFLLAIFLIFNLRSQQSFGLTLILTGGFSNYSDRIFRGAVIDYLCLPVAPCFNLADFAIVLGSIFVLVDLFKKGKVL